MDSVTYLPNAKAAYAAIQDQLKTVPALFSLFTDQPKWYECGVGFWYRKRRSNKQVWHLCRKFAGHPGRHAKRRTGTSHE